MAAPAVPSKHRRQLASLKSGPRRARRTLKGGSVVDNCRHRDRIDETKLCERSPGLDCAAVEE
ncbi:MAG: hypothetical protein ACT4QF_15795 [Sporichthyaceae bacterium]